MVLPHAAWWAVSCPRREEGEPPPLFNKACRNFSSARRRLAHCLLLTEGKRQSLQERERHGQALPISHVERRRAPLLASSLIQSGKARWESLHCLSSCCVVGRVLSLQRGKRASPLLNKACHPLFSARRGLASCLPSRTEIRQSLQESGARTGYSHLVVLLGGLCLAIAERQTSLPRVE